VSEVVTWWLSVPLAPVILKVNVPREVRPDVRTVSVDTPDEVTGLGEKLAVAPAGRPPNDRATLPVKPLSAEIVAV
jgi:hypothetical protein